MITICEVGPRDGLQNEPKTLPPRVRAELVDRLVRAGVPRIEVTSFVSDSVVPQMAQAEEVVASLSPADGVTYAGLVLNVRGYERLAACSLTEAHFAFGCTDAFNRRNQNASVEESIGVARELINRSRAEGIRLVVTLAVAFGCPFAGPVDPEWVLEVTAALAEAGADEIVLADTIGVAVPAQVRQLVGDAVSYGKAIGVHLHDTRGRGIANAYAAVESGASVLESAVGGIGGCPFAPGAPGNVGTEDLIAMLHRGGVETGIDLDEMIRTAHWMNQLLGKVAARTRPVSRQRLGPRPCV